MTQELDNKQKKEWAKLLFLTTDLTQAEIAVKIGVSRITIVRWAKEWEGLKLNFLQTREARIKSTLMQLNELDESIAAREQGARYPTVKEADIRRKLTADLEALEQEASVRDIVNVSRDILDYVRRLEKLEKDPVSWMLFFFAEYTRHPFTSFQKKAIRRITSNPEWYEVLSWSRELAKSTIVFMCIMYLVLTKRTRHVLLVSNSHENATRLLDPYKKSFEQNSLLKAYYGDLREAGNWTADEFSLTSGAAFRALGAMESPRGTRKDAFRPDTILPDDFDTDADCRNPDIVKKKWQWFEEALIPTRSVSGDLLVVFCGNVIARDCCVTRAGAKADHCHQSLPAGVYEQSAFRRRGHQGGDLGKMSADATAPVRSGLRRSFSVKRPQQGIEFQSGFSARLLRRDILRLYGISRPCHQRRVRGLVLQPARLCERTCAGLLLHREQQPAGSFL